LRPFTNGQFAANPHIPVQPVFTDSIHIKYNANLRSADALFACQATSKAKRPRVFKPADGNKAKKANSRQDVLAAHALLRYFTAGT
jgi:hypothetical protein